MLTWAQFWTQAVYTLGVYNGITTFAIGIVTVLTFFISCATCCMVCRQNKSRDQRVHPAHVAEPAHCHHNHQISYMPASHPQTAAYFLVPNHHDSGLRQSGAKQIMTDEGPAIAVPNPPLYAPRQQQQPQDGIYPNIQ